MNKQIYYRSKQFENKKWFLLKFVKLFSIWIKAKLNMCSVVVFVIVVVFVKIPGCVFHAEPYYHVSAKLEALLHGTKKVGNLCL